MRRLTALTLSMMMLVAAAGCGDDDTSDLSTTTASVADSPAASTTVPAPVTSTTVAQSEEDPTDGTDDDGDDPGDGSTGGDGTFPAGPYGWTPECVAGLVTFFKIAESAVSAIDWSTATNFEVTDINAQFSVEADVFEALMTDQGCGQEMFATAEGFAFMRDLAVAHTPGMLGYIDFIAESELGG